MPLPLQPHSSPLVFMANIFGRSTCLLVCMPLFLASPRVMLSCRLAHSVDLFVDTHFYTAHSTASDALWSGVPLLAMPSPTFQGRVAAAGLRAVGLPLLITHTLKVGGVVRTVHAGVSIGQARTPRSRHP